MKRQWLKKACEEVDASIFTGDVLFDHDDYIELCGYIARWNKEIREHEENKEDTQCPNQPTR